jgi:hypothetical protein
MKKIYKTRDLATADISDYIQKFYNPIRRHGHLGGVSPETFEAALRRHWSVSVKDWELHSVRFYRGNSSDPVPISDHQLPTRLGDKTFRIMDDWDGNHTGPSWPISG